MAAHSRFLAWRIPWTEEPGGLQSMGLQELDTTKRLNHHHHHIQFANILLRTFASMCIRNVLCMCCVCLCVCVCVCVCACSIMVNSFQPHGLQPIRLLCPWDFQAQHTEWVAFLPLGDVPNPGIETVSPISAGRFFTTALLLITSY